MESELQSLLIHNEREAHEVEQILDDVKAAKERLALIEREIQMVHYFWHSFQSIL